MISSNGLLNRRHDTLVISSSGLLDNNDDTQEVCSRGTVRVALGDSRPLFAACLLGGYGAYQSHLLCLHTGLPEKGGLETSLPPHVPDVCRVARRLYLRHGLDDHHHRCVEC